MLHTRTGIWALAGCPPAPTSPADTSERECLLIADCLTAGFRLLTSTRFCRCCRA
jgi:hypothetical protein